MATSITGSVNQTVTPIPEVATFMPDSIFEVSMEDLSFVEMRDVIAAILLFLVACCANFKVRRKYREAAEMQIEIAWLLDDAERAHTLHLSDVELDASNTKVIKSLKGVIKTQQNLIKAKDEQLKAQESLIDAMKVDMKEHNEVIREMEEYSSELFEELKDVKAAEERRKREDIQSRILELRRQMAAAEAKKGEDKAR